MEKYIVHSCSYSDRELEQKIIAIVSDKEKAIDIAEKEYKDCQESMIETYGEDSVFSSRMGWDSYEVREENDEEIWQIEITKVEDDEN